MKIITLTVLAAICASSCNRDKTRHDASGTFEAVETIVPAEATGIIEALDIEEGQTLQAGQVVGYIDSTQLWLKKRQLESQIDAVLSRKPDIARQTAALQEQLRQAEREQKRIAGMVQADAATSKQLDDAGTQVAVIRKQIDALQSSLRVTTASLSEETSPIVLQIAQLEDQLSRCRIVNPVNGTVLTKYAETYEMALSGKPLYRIADLGNIRLRAYITGDQFAQVQLQQQVKVLVDDGAGDYKAYDGSVVWISDKAEFTPKTIQTKDERANLVYAVKIRVKNDGYLKIGMYGDVVFNR